MTGIYKDKPDITLDGSVYSAVGDLYKVMQSYKRLNEQLDRIERNNNNNKNCHMNVTIAFQSYFAMFFLIKARDYLVPAKYFDHISR